MIFEFSILEVVSLFSSCHDTDPIPANFFVLTAAPPATPIIEVADCASAATFSALILEFLISALNLFAISFTATPAPSDTPSVPAIEAAAETIKAPSVSFIVSGSSESYSFKEIPS